MKNVTNLNDDIPFGGASLLEIAKKCGYRAPSGARQAMLRALEKAKFLYDEQSDDDYNNMIELALNDYVKKLCRALGKEDASALRTGRTYLKDSPEFRHHLKKYINRAMRNKVAK